MHDLLLGLRLLHRSARYRWKLNRREIGAMLECLPRGGVALDVGMHKGGYAFWMSRAVGRSGRVFGFEPQERVVIPTRAAFAGLGMRNVRITHAAVSDRSGTGAIAVRRGSTHGASMEGLEGDGVDQVPVPLVALDDFASGQGLERVDFIKIDVEGHEQKVLEGARTILGLSRPALLVEIEARHQRAADGEAAGGVPDPVASARGLLEPLGYRGEFFTALGRLPIERFSAAEHQVYGQGYYSNNFLFRPR